MEIAIVVGTRPEIIKMSPIIHECIKNNIQFKIIHSNQHYSQDLDKVFFDELNLPQPDYNLNIGSKSHLSQISKMLFRFEEIFSLYRPTIVLVQGDTNTVLAGALAANKLGIKLGHIEAGLRSHDKSMPEEHNRILTDHISDFLFAVSDIQVHNLKKEGIEESKIFQVGNTIVDAVNQNVELANQKSKILYKLNLSKDEFFLFTSHRSSNVDDKKSFEEILELISEIPGLVCWPIHPRSKKQLTKFNLRVPSNLVLTEPLGYLDFLQLQQNAKMIITDSGGVQEEACILLTPCITIRENTERPETIDVGSNQLVGRCKEKLKLALASNKKQWCNPFGDGKTSVKILEILNNSL